MAEMMVCLVNYFSLEVNDEGMLRKVGTDIRCMACL